MDKQAASTNLPTDAAGYKTGSCFILGLYKDDSVAFCILSRFVASYSFSWKFLLF